MTATNYTICVFACFSFYLTTFENTVLKRTLGNNTPKFFLKVYHWCLYL